MNESLIHFLQPPVLLWVLNGKINNQEHSP